jgi:serine/threonine-protein kinase
VEAPPLPFAKRGAAAWPEVEAVLGRALAKRPTDRFADLAAFAAALRGAGSTPTVPRPTPAIARRGPEDDLLERAIDVYALDGEATRDGPSSTPRASVNFGAGGVAYALHRFAARRGDARLLALADVWIQKAFTLARGDEAFSNAELDAARTKVGVSSLFNGPTGLLCVRALVSNAQGDRSGASTALAAFLEGVSIADPVVDLTLGRAGALLGCAELLESMRGDASVIGIPALVAAGNAIATDLARLVEIEDLASVVRFETLGVAHGLSGVLFALLRWSRATGAAPPAIARRRLEELAGRSEPHGLGLRWPIFIARPEPSFFDGWCNGAAGHALVFALAHEVLGPGGFGEIAERAAHTAWSAQNPGGTLCCGLGGMAYALAAVHRIGGGRRWLERARVLARRAALDRSDRFPRDALYKGALGVAVLADGLREDGATAMPLFEPSPF